VWRALASVSSMQPLREKPGILILVTKTWGINFTTKNVKGPTPSSLFAAFKPP
jgi:hypothetical protein